MAKEKKERVVFRREKQKCADSFLAAFPEEPCNPGMVACLPFFVRHSDNRPLFEPFTEVSLDYYYKTKPVRKGTMCAEACKEAVEKYYDTEFEVAEKLTSGRRKRCV